MRKDLFNYFDDGRYFTAHPTPDIEELSLTIRLFLAAVGETQPESMLEVGAANGFLVNRANKSGIFTVGVDISSWALRNSPQEVKGCLVHASADHLPFKDKCFQVVMSRALLEHIPEEDCDRAVRELERVGHKNIHHLTMATGNPSWRGGDETHVAIEPRSWWVGSVIKVKGEHWVLHAHEDKWDGKPGTLILNGRYAGPMDVGLPSPSGSAYIVQPAPPALWCTSGKGGRERMVGLNLGCGPILFPSTAEVEWINIDKEDMTSYLTYLIHAPDDWSGAGMKRMPNHQRQLSLRVKIEPVKLIQRDLRERFPFQDGYADLVYCGQVIEHFTPVEARTFLQECRRVMKQGALLRLSTPDLDKLLAAYTEGKMGKFDEDQPLDYHLASTQSIKLGWLIFGSLGTGREYQGHKMIYNFDSLREALTAAGFEPTLVRRMECGLSQNPAMQRGMYEYPEHAGHSLFVEVVK